MTTKLDTVHVPIALELDDSDGDPIDELIVDAIAQRVIDKLTTPHVVRAPSSRIVMANDLINQIVELFGVAGTVYRVVIDAKINEALDVRVYHRGTEDVLKLDLGDPQGINLTEIGTPKSDPYDRCGFKVFKNDEGA